MMTQVYPDTSTDAKWPTATDAIRTYAEAVFEPGDIAEIRIITKKGETATSIWEQASLLPTLTDRLRKQNERPANIHIGANPRRAKGLRGDAAIDIARTHFCDHDHTTVEAAIETINKNGMPPATLTISSGHGVHIYWRLAEAVREAELAEWEILQKDIALHLGGDPAVYNRERVMRPPGFLNVKAEPFQPVTIVDYDPNRVYHEYDLRGIVPEMTKAAAAPTKQSTYRPGLNGQASVIDEFDRRHDIKDILRSENYRDAGNRMIHGSALRAIRQLSELARK